MHCEIDCCRGNSVKTEGIADFLNGGRGSAGVVLQAADTSEWTANNYCSEEGDATTEYEWIGRTVQQVSATIEELVCAQTGNG